MQIPLQIAERAGEYSDNIRRAAEELCDTHKKHLKAIIIGERIFARNITDPEGGALGNFRDANGRVITAAELIFLMDYKFASLQGGSMTLPEFLDHLDKIGKKHSIEGKFRLEVYACPYKQYSPEGIAAVRGRVIYAHEELKLS